MNYILIGMESSGKTALVRALAGGTGASARFRGTTLACETYRNGAHSFTDTPGILRTVDSATTRIALDRLELDTSKSETQVMLVLHGEYLAGVLLPCLVTLWTISREFTSRYALKLSLRRIAGAAGFSLILAWLGPLLLTLLP